MKKLALALLAVVALGLVADDSQAFGRRRSSCAVAVDCAPACAPATTVIYVDREVIAHKAVYKKHETKEKVYRMHTRTEVVPVEYKVLVPKWDKVKSTVMVCRSEPVEVVREVVTCQYTSVTCVDPCTGCTYTRCVPQHVAHKVKTIVHQPRWEKQDVWTTVCRYEEQPRKDKITRLVCEWKEHVVDRVYYTCHMEPYRTVVRVPVVVPCAPAAPAVVASAPCHH